MNHDEIKIILTKRGKDKLLYQGFAYHLHKKLLDKKAWRCVDRKCKGFIYTDFNYVIIKYIDHDKCNKNYNKNEALNLRNNMYKRSIKTNEKPINIVISEMKIGSPLIIKEFLKI
ncbi:hypothetical protein DMUE_2063 [Dictyocoela muelleri]|nr:hypothetical protein DMUE_2063 [Dictyocoela muelleri]